MEPFEEWPSSSTPAYNADKWRDFLEAFAVVVSASRGDAVQHQVRWGMPVDTDDSTHEWFGGRAHTANHAPRAALDAGFIRHAPDLIAARSQRDRDSETEAA